MALHLVQPEPDRPKLIIEGVSKRFLSKRATVEALENVSLTVAQGEFVCLVGPSGCGKSTLLDIMAGLTKPDRGQVLADGQRVTGPGQQRLVMFPGSSMSAPTSLKTAGSFGKMPASTGIEHGIGSGAVL